MTDATATAVHRLRGSPQTEGMGGEELRGRSTGVVVGAVMGLVWTGSALGLLSAVVAVPVLVAGVAVCAALMAGARRMHSVATALAAPLSSEVDLGRVRSRFTLVVAAESVAIAVAVNVLVRTGHPQWIAAVICAAVGLHFVPLARLFRIRLYYASAVGLCAIAAATMLVGAAGAPAVLWRLLPGFGAALALWTTSASLLATTRTPSS